MKLKKKKSHYFQSQEKSFNIQKSLLWCLYVCRGYVLFGLQSDSYTMQTMNEIPVSFCSALLYQALLANLWVSCGVRIY